MEGEPNELSPVEKLKELAATAREAIEAEFARTKNSWLACFGSRLFVIETWLDLRSTREMIPAEQYSAAQQKLEELKTRLFDLKERFPEKENVPPEEIKHELITALDILA